jgi:hypothetical protein
VLTTEPTLLISLITSLPRNYIDDTDQDTKSTFSLLMEPARLELHGKGSAGPQLTLPLSGK